MLVPLVFLPLINPLSNAYWPPYGMSFGFRGTTKCVEPTEDEELEEERQNLFPSYRHQFEQDVSSCLNSEVLKPVKLAPISGSAGSSLITPDCLDQVRRLHSAMVNSLLRAQWIVQSESDVTYEMVKPLQERLVD